MKWKDMDFNVLNGALLSILTLLMGYVLTVMASHTFRKNSLPRALQSENTTIMSFYIDKCVSLFIFSILNIIFDKYLLGLTENLPNDGKDYLIIMRIIFTVALYLSVYFDSNKLIKVYKRYSELLEDIYELKREFSINNGHIYYSTSDHTYSEISRELISARKINRLSTLSIPSIIFKICAIVVTILLLMRFWGSQNWSGDFNFVCILIILIIVNFITAELVQVFIGNLDLTYKMIARKNFLEEKYFKSLKSNIDAIGNLDWIDNCRSELIILFKLLQKKRWKIKHWKIIVWYPDADRCDLSKYIDLVNKYHQKNTLQEKDNSAFKLDYLGELSSNEFKTQADFVKFIRKNYFKIRFQKIFDTNDTTLNKLNSMLFNQKIAPNDISNNIVEYKIKKMKIKDGSNGKKYTMYSLKIEYFKNSEINEKTLDDFIYKNKLFHQLNIIVRISKSETNDEIFAHKIFTYKIQ